MSLNHAPLKVGILNADIVRPELQPEFGDYPAMFTELLHSADPTVEIISYDVMEGQYPTDIDEVDAYMVTGSKFSVYDNEAWIHQLGEFIVELNRRKKKLVAICFGHQLVAHFLGGRTEKSNRGWAVGVQRCTFDRELSPTVAMGQHFNFLASHQDQVVQLAQGAESIASSDICPHVMTRIGNHTLTLQWHPEFIKGYVERLLHIRREILGEDVFQVALASLQQPIDNELFARWAIDFMQS